MTSLQLCWLRPVWGDNHFGVNLNSTFADVIVGRLDSLTNGTLYHLFQVFLSPPARLLDRSTA